MTGSSPASERHRDPRMPQACPPWKPRCERARDDSPIRSAFRSVAASSCTFGSSTRTQSESACHRPSGAAGECPVGVAVLAGRSMQALLVGLSPADVSTLSVAVGISSCMTIAGSSLPALRAARANPTEALRGTRPSSQRGRASATLSRARAPQRASTTCGRTDATTSRALFRAMTASASR